MNPLIKQILTGCCDYFSDHFRGRGIHWGCESGMSQSAYFLVLSSGYCGSLWLAAALDRHPGISCSGNRLLGLRIPHNSAFDFSAIDPLLVSHMVDFGGVATPSETFRLCQQRKPGAVAFGDVHGWRVKTLKDFPAEQPALAHLVRHPVVLLERIIQEQIHRYRQFPRIRVAMDGAFSDLCEAYGPLLKGLTYDLADQERGPCFLWGIHELRAVFDEIRSRPDIPLWGFERLIADRAHYADLVSSLTGGAVIADDLYLDTLFTVEQAASSGRFRGSGLTSTTDPADVWDGWLEQEKDVFRRLCAHFDPATLYAPVGYSLDFMNAERVP